ncbi:L domain-like protein [Backusella circina FSU 941]|nr:L domain-like protein [Backusella circina FSU 941]
MTHLISQTKLDLSDCSSHLPSNLFQEKNRFFRKKKPCIKQLLLRRNRLDSLGDYGNALESLKKNLSELSLRENLFKAFPREILVLNNLTSLSLANNRLRYIELGVFSTLVHLEWVNFSGNKLSELPLDITYCQGLKGFDLQNNDFESVPEIIYCIPQLQVLLLQKNQIRQLSNIYRFPDSLHTLNLAFNHLIGVPPILIHNPPSSLTHLYLSGNKLRRLPDDFIATGYEHLVSLDLHTCQLKRCSQQFLVNLSRCQELKRLNLAINYLISIPVEIGLLIHLQWLNLNDNLLASLPDTMIHLTQLVKLGLVQNRLQQLPHLMFSQMEHLQKLDVRRNRLIYLPPSILSLVPRCEIEQCLDLAAPTRVFSEIYCSSSFKELNSNGSLRTLLFFENPPLEQLDGILCNAEPLLSMEDAFLTLQKAKTPEGMRQLLYHVLLEQNPSFSVANSLFEISLRHYLNSYDADRQKNMAALSLPELLVPTLISDYTHKWIQQCDLCQTWYTTEPFQIACIIPMCNGRVQVPIRYNICSIHCVITSLIQLYHILMDWDTPQSELSDSIDPTTSDSNLSSSSISTYGRLHFIPQYKKQNILK